MLSHLENGAILPSITAGVCSGAGAVPEASYRWLGWTINPGLIIPWAEFAIVGPRWPCRYFTANLLATSFWRQIYVTLPGTPVANDCA